MDNNNLVESSDKFSFVVSVNVTTPEHVKDKLRRFVNLHYVGKEQVNVFNEETGKLEPDPSLVITDEHKEAHWHVNAGHRCELKVTVDAATGLFEYEVVK